MGSRRQQGFAWLIRSAFLAVALGASASSAAADGGQTVRAGLYRNEPKIFIDDEGRAAGFFADLLVAIAAAEGWNLEWVECSWSDCLADLEAGRIDLMPDVAWTRDRERRLDFHDVPVIESWSQIYARPGIVINDFKDLNGRPVALLEGSVQQSQFEDLLRGLGYQTELIAASSMEEAFRLAAAGGADAAAVNRFFGERFSAHYGLTPTPIIFGVGTLFFAAGKDRNAGLLEAVDRLLDAWKREPGSPYYVALARWLDLSSEPQGLVARHLGLLVGLAGALLLLAGALVLVLRAQVRARTRKLSAANEELRRAHEALDLERRQLLRIFDGIDEPIYVADIASCEVLFVNRHLRELLGRDPVGGRCHEEFHGMAEPCPFCTNSIILENGGRPHVWEFKNPMLGRDFLLMDRVIRWPDGRDVRLEIALDITERRRAEEERRRLEEQLREAQRLEAIGRLAGGVAHDFNNLLAAIINYAEFAAGALAENDPVRADVLEIVKAGERAATLTRQLLAFSRRQVLEPRVLDLNRVVSGIEDMLRRLLGEDIEIVVQRGEALGTVLADPGQIEQVIMNLAVNARDAMPGGGRLIIETAAVELDEGYAERHAEVKPGPHAMLAVTDTGLGMDAATMERIFDPFFTTKEQGKGTGLGLATCHGIVKQSGGDIWVYSEPGEGTTFKIYLPRTDAPAVEVARRPPADTAGGGETLLLVEDDDEVRAITERILGAAGYEVLAAAGGGAALLLFEQHPGRIDLLLTDVVMPLIGGRELAEQLTARRPGLKVLYMSGYADNAIVHHGVLDRDTHFIAKPFTSAELTRKVREVLDEESIPR